MKKAKKEVSLQIDQGRLIAHLKNFFASSDTFLSELMQNGRRAGASLVEFTFDQKADTITIEDDGGGIDDMQNLLTLARSGWNESVTAADKPFGMGFFAAIFAANECVVESRSQRVHLWREEVIEGTQFGVGPSQRTVGTKVLLRGFSDDFDFTSATRYVEKCARGFPIRVRLDNRELERPHARGSLQGVDTPDGFMSIPKIHFPVTDRTHGRYGGGLITYHITGPNLYLQGLPLGGLSYGEGNPVVHLDGVAGITPKLPDRDRLVNHEAFVARVTSRLHAEARRWLEAQKECMPLYDFARAHFFDCVGLGATDLIADLPVPRSYLIEYDPDSSDVWDHKFYVKCDGDRGMVTPEDIASGDVKVVLFDDYYDGGNATQQYALAIFCRENGYLLVDDALPRTSWLWNHVIDLSEAEVTLDFENSKEAKVSGSEYISIIACTAVTIHVEADGFDETSILLNESFGFEGDLICPGRADDVNFGLLHLSSYCTDNSGDSVDSDVLYEDVEAVGRALKMMDGGDPTEVLKRVIYEASVADLPNMDGEFKLRLVKGEIEVERV
jgi:hypothetical protein